MWEAFRYLLSPGHCSRGRGHRPREAPRHPFRESEGSAVSPLSSAPSQVAGPPFCLLPSGSLCPELFPGCGGWGVRCLLDRAAGEEETGLRPGRHVPAIHGWRLHPSPLPPGLGVRPAHPGRHRHGPGRPRPLCKRHPVAVVRLHGHRPPVRPLALCHDLRVRMGAGMEAAGQLRTPVVAGERVQGIPGNADGEDGDGRPRGRRRAQPPQDRVLEARGGGCLSWDLVPGLRLRRFSLKPETLRAPRGRKILRDTLRAGLGATARLCG